MHKEPDERGQVSQQLNDYSDGVHIGQHHAISRLMERFPRDMTFKKIQGARVYAEDRNSPQLAATKTTVAMEICDFRTTPFDTSSACSEIVYSAHFDPYAILNRFVGMRNDHLAFR